MANIAVPRALVEDHSPESQSLVSDVDVEVRLIFSYVGLCMEWEVWWDVSHGVEFEVTIAEFEVVRKLESGVGVVGCSVVSSSFFFLDVEGGWNRVLGVLKVDVRSQSISPDCERVRIVFLVVVDEFTSLALMEGVSLFWQPEKKAH